MRKHASLVRFEAPRILIVLGVQKLSLQRNLEVLLLGKTESCVLRPLRAENDCDVDFKLNTDTIDENGHGGEVNLFAVFSGVY